MLRLGDVLIAQPSWMSQTELDRTNGSAAVAEAEITRFWTSIGVETTRSERIAASTVAGFGVGATVGAVAVGAPTALAGAAVGTQIGCPLGNVVIPYVGLVPGCVAGGVTGAAAAGVPGAAVGAVVGGGIGAAAGAVLGAGDLKEPTEVTLPEALSNPAALRDRRPLGTGTESAPVTVSVTVPDSVLPGAELPAPAVVETVLTSQAWRDLAAATAPVAGVFAPAAKAAQDAGWDVRADGDPAAADRLLIAPERRAV